MYFSSYPIQVAQLVYVHHLWTMLNLLSPPWKYVLHVIYLLVCLLAGYLKVVDRFL